jgi:hypothetical protein
MKRTIIFCAACAAYIALPVSAENQPYGTLRLSPGAVVCLTAPAAIKTETGAMELPKGSCVTIRPDDPPKPVEVLKPAEPVCPAPVKGKR